MKNVYMNQDNTVREILPAEAVPIAEWYNQEFADHCLEAPDEVEPNWEYNPITRIFYPPGEKPTPVRMAKQEINSI